MDNVLIDLLVQGFLVLKYPTAGGSVRHLHLHYGDLSDSTNLIRIIQEVQPDEIYNLGAMSHVQVSFEEP